MYRCELCRKNVPPRVKCSKLVVKTRIKMYPPREKAKKDGHSKLKKVRDPGTVGREIVREVSVCHACACSLSVR